MKGPYCLDNIAKLVALAQVCATFIGFQRETKVVTVLQKLAFKKLLLLVQILMVFGF